MISANLALALAKYGKRVIVVDLDLGGANLHLNLGQMGLPKGIGSYFEDSSLPLDKIIYPTDHENLLFIPGEAELPGIANVSAQLKQRLLHDLRTLDCDYLVLDLGAGTHCNTTDFFLLSGSGILVASPTLTATLNAYLFLKNSVFRIIGAKLARESKGYQYLRKLKRDGLSLQRVYLSRLLEQLKAVDPESYEAVGEGLSKLKPKLIFNLVGDPKDAQRAVKLRYSCRQYLSVDLEHLGIIYYDETQKRALDARLPVLAYKPKALVSQAIVRIAEKILDRGEGEVSPLDGEIPEGEERRLNESFAEAEAEAAEDFSLKRERLQEHFHSGVLEQGDMIDIIQSQNYEIEELRQENQLLRKKILDISKTVETD